MSWVTYLGRHNNSLFLMMMMICSSELEQCLRGAVSPFFFLLYHLCYLSFANNVMEVSVNVSFLGYIHILEIENLEEENPGIGAELSQLS